MNFIVQLPSMAQNRFILKDTIFNQKDSLHITSNDLAELSMHVSAIHNDFNQYVNRKEETFLGASYDTIFTVVVTIVIFVIGLIADRLYKSHRDKIELRKLKNYFNNQLDKLKDDILPDLIKGYKTNYQETITLDNGMPTTAPKILTNTYDRLSNLESPLLFKSFRNSENFNEAFAQIDLIAKLMEEVDTYHLGSANKSHSIRKAIVELDSKYIEKLVDYLDREKRRNPHYLSDPHYIFMQEKFKLYHDHVVGKRNLTFYYKEIIRPVQEYLVRTHLFRTDPICFEIADYGKRFSLRFNELKRLFVEIRLQYRYFTKVLWNSKMKLDKLNTN